MTLPSEATVSDGFLFHHHHITKIAVCKRRFLWDIRLDF